MCGRGSGQLEVIFLERVRVGLNLRDVVLLGYFVLFVQLFQFFVFFRVSFLLSSSVYLCVCLRFMCCVLVYVSCFVIFLGFRQFRVLCEQLGIILKYVVWVILFYGFFGRQGLRYLLCVCGVSFCYLMLFYCVYMGFLLLCMVVLMCVIRVYVVICCSFIVRVQLYIVVFVSFIV